MNEIREIFTESFQLCTRILSEVTHNEIHDFTQHISTELRPHAFILDDGIADIADKVFSQEVILDFVLSLNYQFFARWGRNPDGLHTLAKTLGMALTQPLKGNAVLIPKEYTDRFRSTDDVVQLLMENPWFIIICLIRLFIVVSSNLENKNPGNDS